MSAEILQSTQTWLWALMTLLLAVAVMAIVHRIVFAVARGIARRTGGPVDDALVRYAYWPTLALALLATVLVMLEGASLPARVVGVVESIAVLLLTASVGWLVIKLSGVVDVYVGAKYDVTEKDNLQARQVHTQTRMLRRILVIAVLVLTVCAMVMSFPGARELGISMFASAGVAGLVIGMAARPALSNIIAGVQLALTQPIRVDDVVIVEGEWGWIEEIRTTYVVVRIWDLRRLVVPLTYFIEQPFQNWTRQTADILGTVFLYADYTVPVGAVREELRRIVQGSEMWDGKVCGLQVTDATQQTMELRALVSAADSGTAWDLRCHVREELLRFLQERYPDALPKARAELHGTELPRPQAA